MNISQHLTKKKLLWLAGTLLVGALGSGLWEAIIKPGMLWFGTLMLNLGTLGLSSLRDGMYADVAKGTYERAGVMLLSIATGSLCGFLTGPLIVGLLLRNRGENGLPTSAVVRIIRKNWALTAVPLIFSMIFFVNLFRVSYIIRASSYADQLIRIVGPYVNDKERLELQSELSQISNRDKYIQLTDKLKRIAVENKASVPVFTVRDKKQLSY